MAAAPDCIIKIGTNLDLVAKYWRNKGWVCEYAPLQDHLNWLMRNIDLDGSRYYPDPDNTKIEILAKRLAARVVKPLVHDTRKRNKGLIY